LDDGHRAMPRWGSDPRKAPMDGVETGGTEKPTDGAVGDGRERSWLGGGNGKGKLFVSVRICAICGCVPPGSQMQWATAASWSCTHSPFARLRLPGSRPNAA
jgi:hypothetical protein